MRRFASLAGAVIVLWLAAGPAAGQALSEAQPLPLPQPVPQPQPLPEAQPLPQPQALPQPRETQAAPQSPPAATDAKLKEIQLASGAFSQGDATPAWVEDAPLSDAPGEQTSLRLQDTQILAGDSPAMFIRRAVAVKDEPSLRTSGQVSIRFHPEYERVQLHALRVLRGGETFEQARSAQVRFLQRETALEQSMYSGVVTASILVNDLRVGDTLEIAYTLYGQNPVFGGKFSQTASWDSAYPSAYRRVIARIPEGRGISWRMHGDGGAAKIAPKETVENGVRKLVFEERNIAATAGDPQTPSDYSAFRWLQFSEFSSWDGVIEWASQLFQGDEEPSAEFRQAVERIRAAPTDAERVTAALELVQSEIRYFSVSIGESSHKPAKPSVLLARRFGDCKDKSLLLVSLLRALGIEANPVLVRSGGRKWLAKALPSPTDFDHVIVAAAVDGKTYFLDPTRLGQHGRLDRMGQAHEGTMVLVISPRSHGPQAVASPAGAALRESEIAETLTVTKLGGPAKLRVRQTWNGTGAESRRVAQSAQTKAQYAKPFLTAMERRYPGAKLSGDPEFEDDRRNNVFAMTQVYDIPAAGTEKNGAWTFNYMPENFGGALPASITAARKAPAGIVVPGYHAKYRIEVQFPPEVSGLHDPESKSLEGKHFTLSFQQSFRGSTAQAALDFKVLGDRVEAQDVPAFLERVRAMNELGSGGIIVGKSDVKTAISSAADVAGRMKAMVRDVVDKAGESIKSGKLQGEDLARAHCTRGTYLGLLGKLGEALDGAEEALKIAPSSGEMFACRGYVHFMRAEFAKAIADYNNAITLGQFTQETFRSRGMARYYAGQLEEAGEDFKKARAAGAKEEQFYNDIWLAWTNFRLKRPLDGAAKSLAEAQPGDAWPRPALAMLAGKLTPEGMLEALNAKKGDERDMALAEGYFYAGEYYLSHGEKEKARGLFAKTRELNVLAYIEHVCAGLELQALDSAR